jgi:hypothetical protein
MPPKILKTVKLKTASKKPIVREKRKENTSPNLRGVSVEDVENFLKERNRRFSIQRKRSEITDSKKRQKQKY